MPITEESARQLLVVILIGGFVAHLFNETKQDRAEEFNREKQSRDEDFEREQQSRIKAFAVESRYLNELRIRAELRADYLTRLGHVYREVKATRRALRVGGLTARYGDPPDDIMKIQACLYMEQMDRINDAQLELEDLKIEAESLMEVSKGR